MLRRTRVTIKDVAREAGCGVATASRVLNKSGPASAETRDRVEDAANKLGFSFSAIGRALQSSRSMTIGCLVPSLANPVFAEAVQGVHMTLAGTGYQLLIASSNYDGGADEDAIATFLSKEVDGLIVTMVGPGDSRAMKMSRERAVPATLMFHDPVGGFTSAYVDNVAASREVARQLHRLGHWQTCFLALRFSCSDRSRNRFAGFLSECRLRGMPDPTLIELSEEDAKTPENLARIIERIPDVTAIFASNDFLAISLQRAARILGLQVPRDLSVVGFDGIETGRLLEVPIATIETAPEAMGRQAAATLLSSMQGKTLPQQPALPFTFRAGATLAPPRPESDNGRGAARPLSVHPSLEQNLKRTNR